MSSGNARHGSLLTGLSPEACLEVNMLADRAFDSLEFEDDELVWRALLVAATRALYRRNPLLAPRLHSAIRGGLKAVEMARKRRGERTA